MSCLPFLLLLPCLFLASCLLYERVCTELFLLGGHTCSLLRMIDREELKDANEEDKRRDDSFLWASQQTVSLSLILCGFFFPFLLVVVRYVKLLLC